jgi:hypothetical protein
MDSERKDDKQEGGSKRENGDPLPILRNFFSTSWIRHNNKNHARLWDSVLEYNVYFLPIVSVFFWFIYLLLKW